ncbi:MAG: glycosyltransferase [Bryobacterales bacterium]|nr:glycosyltransferase [Bryobacterales bacterium]
MSAAIKSLEFPNTGLSVALLCTNLARGGAETQVASLAFALHQRGYRVCVISMLAPTAFAEELQESGIAVHSLGMQPGKASLAGFIRLIFLLRRVQPHVLHAHLFHANLLARAVRLLCPLPVVISTIHSLAESSRSSSRIAMRDRIYRWTDLLSDTTVCVSEAVAERHRQARAISPPRLRVILNASDPARFCPDAERRVLTRAALQLGDTFTWLSVGRLMWKKDYPTLLKAMAILPDCQLLIAGEGPLEAELQQQANEAKVRVRFLGSQSEIPQLMNACDGFVLSSVVEGLPVVLIEAALSAMPCVATNVGGVREVFPEDGGFLVPSGDHEALSAAMRRVMMLDVAARSTLGGRARAHAIQRFSADAVTAQWELLYRKLLERVSAPGRA